VSGFRCQSRASQGSRNVYALHQHVEMQQYSVGAQLERMIQRAFLHNTE